MPDSLQTIFAFSFDNKITDDLISSTQSHALL